VTEHGARVDQTNEAGTTALIVAAASGKLNVVKCLVDELGANINQGSFALHSLCVAAYDGHYNVVLFIVTAHARAWAMVLEGGINWISSEIKMHAETTVS
jgi:ankyrin repeat protein